MRLSALIRIAFWRSLARSRRGVAYMEFALALPVLLGVGLVGLEMVNLVFAHLRISNISMMTADNASRVRDSIDEADVVELMTGAKMTGSNINFAENGRVILSSLEEVPTGTYQWIRWQRCDGAKAAQSSYGFALDKDGQQILDGTEIKAVDRISPSTRPSAPEGSINHSKMTEMGPPGNRIAAPGGTAIMVAEVVYDYQPIVFHDTMGGIEIRYTNAFNVRQRANQLLNNGGRITPKRCDVFSA